VQECKAAALPPFLQQQQAGVTQAQMQGSRPVGRGESQRVQSSSRGKAAAVAVVAVADGGHWNRAPLAASEQHSS
jgi:hypothetical protein